MSLSILCITNNEYEGTREFIADMGIVAASLGAEFVLGLDREKAQIPELRELATKTIDLTAKTLQEDVMDEALSACSGDWILRLDDDEKVSPALLKWLAGHGYEKSFGNLYAFPRVYMYGDTSHVLANDGIYPDLQTRLGRKELMFGVNHVHAGNRYGTGMVIPYAIEHHKLLVRTLEQRREIAARYEAMQPGAGSNPIWSRYNLPEDVYSEMVVKEYADGDYSA